MPYFAHITNGLVDRVERIDAAMMTDDSGQEVEALGQAYLAELHGGDPGDYVQCWYPVGQPVPYPRGRYPGCGDMWNGTEFVAGTVA